MKKERIDYYIEYIFNYFRRNDCVKAGHGLMVRTIRFTSEKSFTRPKMNNLWFVIDLLIQNDYLKLKENDFICLTEKGSDYINGIDDLTPSVNFEQLIDPEKSLNKDIVYNSLWALIGTDDDDTLYYTQGSMYYNTIRHYLEDLALPTTYGEYIELLRKTTGKTTRGIWYRDLFKALKDADVPLFLRDLSVNVNKIIESMYAQKEETEDFDIFTDIIEEPKPNKKRQVMIEPAPQIEAPVVLISYAWEEEDAEYMNWVVRFAGDLRNNGINAQIDKYQPHGTDLVKFMLNGIRTAQKVLCILTPKYKEKAESGKGGAAYEGTIISHEIYNDQDTIKFIPILRKGDFRSSTPDFIDGRKGFDCTTLEKYQKELVDIVKTIKGEPVVEVPPIYGIHLPKRTLKELKRYCRILFIDDDMDFKTIGIIKNDGWTKTSHILDIESLDRDDIRLAHIICLDIQGVGQKLDFRKEGLGLLRALKEKYPYTAIIAYSAQSKGSIDCFDEDLNKADRKLSKTTDPYQFILTLKDLAKDTLSYENCSLKIKYILEKEHDIQKSEYEIKMIIKCLINGENYSNVIEKFHIPNNPYILQIIESYTNIVK